MARALRIHANDNVAVALLDIAAGDRITVVSDVGEEDVRTSQAIPFAHKVALGDIAEGEDILKYGVPVGFATQAIRRGEWVHQHNTKSHFEARRAARQ
ncbi:MAG: UxaA family hydrolase [Acidobacteria bacterium]|nr:UxaA family hydrolase [Acidobacteriota bacterium]